MDPLIEYVEDCKEAGFIDAAKLKAHIEALADSEDKSFLDLDVFHAYKSYDAGDDTIPYEKGLMVLKKVLPRVYDELYEGSHIVPESTANTRTVASATPFDRRRLIDTPRTKRTPATAAAAGAKLLQRNVASLTNDEYDARASSIQSALVSSISTYAARNGLGPPQGLAVDTARVPASTRPSAEQPAPMDFSDTAGGISTPQVTRKALRHHMQSKSRSSPGHDGQTREVPASPASPYRESRSPVPEMPLPSRFNDMDSTSRKYLDELHSKNTELQRKIAERDRQLDRIERHNEKTAVKLERDLDECKADLTMRRREIDRLKMERDNYLENLKTAEAEIERVGIEQSNATAQSASLRKQLEKKSGHVDEANRRVLEHQSEILSLKSSLNANYQQQEQLAKEHRLLVMQHQELSHELSAAREFKAEADAAYQENIGLNETIDALRLELGDLRLQIQAAAQANPEREGSGPGAGGAVRRLHGQYTSLQDELAHNGARDLLGVDDAAGDEEAAVRARRGYGMAVIKHGGTQTMLKPLGTALQQLTPSELAGLKEDTVRKWVSTLLAKCTSEDLVTLHEVWKRIGYVDGSAEFQDKLRSDLLDVFMAPYKYGLRDAIRSRANVTLSRIVDNVAGEYGNARISAGHQHGSSWQKSGAAGLKQAITSSQHTTVAFMIYTVVIFCLGIITAYYMNISQPLAASLPFSSVNSTVATAIKGPGDGGMHQVRQFLVVDDSPVNRYYSPLRKRAPRSRLGEIMFYWMETLLWDDTNTQIPS